MEKKKLKNVILYLFYGILTIALLVFILSMNDIGEILNTVKTVDVTNLVIALILVLVYLGLYPLTMCLLTKAEHVDVKFIDVYTIGMTEHFFNGITPFSTGGQPFQIYALTKKKVKLSTSTSLLMMNFIIFMIVTNLFALCSLFYFDKFVTTDSMRVVAIIGFTMNFLVLFFMIALATSKTIKKGIIWILTKLSKIKFLTKLLESRIVQVNEYIEQTQSAFLSLWKHKLTFILCFLIRAVTMAVYYGITFFILRSLHVEIGINQLFFVICGSAFAITMVVFMPTPGSSGGIEFAFSSIFAALALESTSSLSYSGMLIWRLITYYLTMLISLAFYIGFEINVRITDKKNRTLEEKIQ